MDDILLVVSELVTNAMLHTGSRATELTVAQTGGAIRVEVGDSSSTPPVPASQLPRSDDTQGRGLLLVDAVAEHWGVERDDRGKHVWAEVN